MSNQLKYGFKKESAQFFRTFKFWGIVLAIFGFAIANPMMYKVSGMVFSEMNKVQQPTAQTAQIIQTTQAEIAEDAPDSGLLGGMGVEDMAAIYSNASATYSMSLVSFSTYSLLIVMLVMMPVAGGEQKKRAMIVPLCSGLRYKNYLIPKFVIYPLSVFALTFLGGLTAGGLCNSIFDNGKVDIGMMAFGALLMAVYIAFIVTVYLSLGLCTSRPGVMVGAVFLGQLMLQTFLEGMGLKDYQPFSLVTAVGEMYTSGSEGYDLAAKMPSILTSIGLSVVIGVLMFFLALGVLNAKKIDNEEEEKPAF